MGGRRAKRTVHHRGATCAGVRRLPVQWCICKQKSVLVQSRRKDVARRIRLQRQHRVGVYLALRLSNTPYHRRPAPIGGGIRPATSYAKNRRVGNVTAPLLHHGENVGTCKDASLQQQKATRNYMREGSHLMLSPTLLQHRCAIHTPLNHFKSYIRITTCRKGVDETGTSRKPAPTPPRRRYTSGDSSHRHYYRLPKTRCTYAHQ